VTNKEKKTSARRALTLTRKDKMQIVFSPAWGPRVLGLFFLVVGLAVLVAPLVLIALGIKETYTLTNEETGEESGIISILLFGGVFVSLGTAIGLPTDRFSIDLTTRRYTDSSGFPLFTRTVTGDFEDFDRLKLEREDFEGDVDTPRGVVWRAKLVWKNADRVPIPLIEKEPRLATMGQDRRRYTLEEMTELAEQLGLSAFDETGTQC